VNRFLILLALTCCALPLAAQKLNGFWKGTLSMTNGCFPQNHIELQITMHGNEASGDSYHYLDMHNYVKKRFRGHYDPATGKLTLQETTVTTFKIGPHCTICIKKYELYYSKEGKLETLSGGWTGYMQAADGSCAPGQITLSRIPESAFKEIPEIAVDTGEIRLDFYDNNQVDGDSISVVVNGKTVLSHQRLTAKPITLHVRIDPSTPFQEVEMRAENLGTIPPNTAVLIVSAGGHRYQLFLSSTETKSARVRFVYDETRRGRLGDIR